MAYQIYYGPRKRKTKRRNRGRAALLIFVFLGAMLMSIQLKGIGEDVRRVLLPGDPEVTAQALQNLEQNIHNGDRIGEALMCFCQEIIDAADTPR